MPGIAESVKETEHPCHLFDLCHSHLFCFKRVLRGLIWWPLFNAWFKIVSNSLRSFTEGEDEEMEDHDGAKDHTAENRQEFFRVMARRRMKQKQFLEEIVVGQEVSPRCQRWGGLTFSVASDFISSPSIGYLQLQVWQPKSSCLPSWTFSFQKMAPWMAEGNRITIMSYYIGASRYCK